MSQYLGNEVVIVGRQAKRPGFAIVADVKQGGLDDFLNQQFPASNAKPGITVLDQNSLSAAKSSSQSNRNGYAVVREHEAIFSNSIATLAQINAQLNAGSSGFAASGFWPADFGRLWARRGNHSGGGSSSDDRQSS